MSKNELKKRDSHSDIKPSNVVLGKKDLFYQGVLKTFKRSLWYGIPVILLLISTSFELLSHDLENNLLLIMSAGLFILGLPVSAALRVDELSLYMGGHDSKELVLFIALLISIFNLCLIFGVREVLLGNRKK